MDSSASDSRKEIACTTNFSKLSNYKTKHKKIIIILVNILLHICFITFLKCKIQKKSNSKYDNVLKTIMGLVAVANIQKEQQEELHLPKPNNMS